MNVISSRAVQDVLQFILVSAGSKGFVRDIELRKVLDNARKDVRDGIVGKVREKFDQIFGLKVWFLLRYVADRFFTLLLFSCTTTRKVNASIWAQRWRFP